MDASFEMTLPAEPASPAALIATPLPFLVERIDAQFRLLRDGENMTPDKWDTVFATIDELRRILIH